VKFLLDHDVPDDVAFSLEALGHAVVKLREVLPPTTPDDVVLRQAGERDSVLITCNRDDFLAAAGHVPTAASSYLSAARLAHWRGRRWCDSWIRPGNQV
jgi:predicted nuclease of predicted toxin-antitoxin system